MDRQDASRPGVDDEDQRWNIERLHMHTMIDSNETEVRLIRVDVNFTSIVPNRHDGIEHRFWLRLLDHLLPSIGGPKQAE